MDMIFFPILRCRLHRQQLQVIFEGTDVTGNIVSLFQRLTNYLLMLRTHFPNVWRSGIGTGSGIRNIEQIPQARLIPAVVDHGNADGFFLDISVHFFNPDFDTCHRRGIRALNVNAKLLIIVIFVETSCELKKVRPIFIGLGTVSCNKLR